MNKTNRRTEFQFYWYYDSTCFGQSFCPLSVLNRTSALIYFMQIWWPFATRSRMELQFHHALGSKRSSNLHKIYQCRCTVKNSWWWAERLPETYKIIIPIKLEFNASVGFIHKEKKEIEHIILFLFRPQLPFKRITQKFNTMMCDIWKWYEIGLFYTNTCYHSVRLWVQWSYTSHVF